MGIFDFFRTKKEELNRDGSRDATGTVPVISGTDSKEEQGSADQPADGSWFDSFMGGDGGGDGGGGGE